MTIRISKISVNIWDDYHDDGYVPEGETQHTYAYIESQLPPEECKHVLIFVKNEIEKLISPEWNLVLSVEYYDSAKVYPHLVGTEHENILYKRWQLEFNNLTHENREWLVEQLEKQALHYQNIPLDIYSES